MAEACARAVVEGVQVMAFGDLFLEDIRAYRLERLAGTGLEAVFPCWGLETAALAHQMVAAGVQAHLVCVDPKQLDKRFAGRAFDAELLAELPAHVDPCGERGEFHSFVSGGPAFSVSIQVERGAVVERDGFVYADLLAVAS
jgi:diphthamide synthase (EF-2-diphthine--ammonia ligase)